MLKYSQYENHLCAERTPFSAFCLFSVHLQERYESIHSSDSWTQKVDFTLLLFLQMSHSAGLRFYFYGQVAQNWTQYSSVASWLSNGQEQSLDTQAGSCWGVQSIPLSRLLMKLFDSFGSYINPMRNIFHCWLSAKFWSISTLLQKWKCSKFFIHLSIYWHPGITFPIWS